MADDLLAQLDVIKAGLRERHQPYDSAQTPHNVDDCTCGEAGPYPCSTLKVLAAFSAIVKRHRKAVPTRVSSREAICAVCWTIWPCAEVRLIRKELIGDTDA